VLTTQLLPPFYYSTLQYAAKEFGTCPLVQCAGQPVLPVGLKDEMGADTVKIFCPKCQCVYHPPPVRGRSSHHGGAGAAGVDGAAFGTTFPHLFLMTFSNLVPDRLTAESAYVPRVFGFRVHLSARQRASASATASSNSSRPADNSNKRSSNNFTRRSGDSVAKDSKAAQEDDSKESPGQDGGEVPELEGDNGGNQKATKNFFNSRTKAGEDNSAKDDDNGSKKRTGKRRTDDSSSKKSDSNSNGMVETNKRRRKGD
jgi:hypothetical protein